MCACMPCCLIYSSKRWQLRCFHSFAIKIIMQWTWGCRYVFPISLHCLQKNTQKWNRWVFTFSEASRLFSRVAAPINKHTNSEHMFPFLHILFNICYLCSFWWQPFWLAWGGISLQFWFAFPGWLVMLNIFHVSVVHLHIFFRKRSIRFLCPFLFSCSFSAVELYEFFTYIGY